jgi:hypothetical protein
MSIPGAANRRKAKAVSANSNSELSILRVGGQAFFAAFELKS